MKTRTIEIRLIISDNEAYTALVTLRRLGIDLGDLRRADVWRFETEDAYDPTLLERVRTLETIYNPNKHALCLRDGDCPEPGEVWIDEPAHGVLEAPVRISGQELAGVARAKHSTAWRLLLADGEPAPAETVDRAVRILLCNSAFQRATT
jgi:hypothetical protein